MGVDEFEADLDFMVEKLGVNLNNEMVNQLDQLRNKLVRLHRKNVVKINHSIMELVCAKYLIIDGYEVDVEHFLSEGLVCDLYAMKGMGTVIIEVETGFVPPEHALDPMIYCKTRITSKITRYSNYANKFGLGTPPHYTLQIPPALTKPPRYRKPEELDEIKAYCDRYYKNPPVSMDELRNARLHAVYVINVDEASIQETDSEIYLEKCGLRY